MHDIGTAEVPEKSGDIDEFGEDGSEVFDRACESQPWGERWIDWDEPRLNFSIAVPLAKQSVGLNRLAAEDFQRGRNERHVELSHANGGVANDTPAGRRRDEGTVQMADIVRATGQ